MKEEITANEKISYCISNGIKIYPQVQPTGDYKLVVAKYSAAKGWAEKIGTTIYSRQPSKHEQNWADKVVELYEYYYAQIQKQLSKKQGDEL